MIGTSISVENSNIMLYPSITICRQPGIAHYKDGDMLGSGSLYPIYFNDNGSMDKNATHSINPFSLALTPDLSDLLVELKTTNHGSNMTTFMINNTDINGHYGLFPDFSHPAKGRFEVRLKHLTYKM